VEFTLCYRGPLKATTRTSTRMQHKHDDLRKHFHLQLKALWQQEPLSSHRMFLDPSEDGNVLHAVEPFQLVATVSSRLQMVADLAITMLRPEPPGSIVTQSGDIDNRLKTLLDALKVPTRDEVPSNATPESGEPLFFCLLEDDDLNTSLDIRTDRLLDPANPSEVLLLLHVKTRLVVGTFGNLGLV
jgi:hypothetical protein